MADSIDEPPTSIDDVAIVRSFYTPGRFDKNNNLYNVFSVNSSVHGDSAQIRECKTCFCLIGSVEGHYKASHSDFDLSSHYKTWAYKAVRRWQKFDSDPRFAWYMYGEVSK